MRVLSGIQPSGKLHWGNYFAMMRPAIALQDRGEAFLFIANYHALTSVADPDVLREGTRDAALDFLACGLNPEKAVLFRQSDVPEVTELTWILSSVTPMGLLERCHSYKDKIAMGLSPTHALFSYPVLMTADILAYQSNIVPVGRDQKQHIEVARDIAIKFNNRYGETFAIPEPEIGKDVAVVPGIDGKKMSKSYDNHVELFGSEKEIKKRVMRIVTDSTPMEEPKNPDTCNVFALYKLFASPEEIAQMRKQYEAGGYGYGDAKKDLLAKSSDVLRPFRERREELVGQPDYVDSVLAAGAERARSEIEKTLTAVRRAIGLD
mgnify:CR=1 FL=1